MNEVCADCGFRGFTPTGEMCNPQDLKPSCWLCLTYGIFLCPECSELHKSLFNEKNLKPVPIQVEEL